MPQFHSGRQGKVKTAGIDLPIVSWEGDFSCERIEVTNAQSGGFAEFIPGVIQGTAKFLLLWDSTAPPHLSPGLVEGASVACELHCGATGKCFSGTLFVERCRYLSQVRARPLAVEASGAFTGSYARPAA